MLTDSAVFYPFLEKMNFAVFEQFGNKAVTQRKNSVQFYKTHVFTHFKRFAGVGKKPAVGNYHLASGAENRIFSTEISVKTFFFAAPRVAYSAYLISFGRFFDAVLKLLIAARGINLDSRNRCEKRHIKNSLMRFSVLPDNSGSVNKKTYRKTAYRDIMYDLVKATLQKR